MPAPNSYTMEDVIEIQAHGGAVVMREILTLVVEQGARLAEAGEFTRRAYLNGRLDLSRAEAVIDVIQAKTKASLKISSRQLDGAVGRLSDQIREKLMEAQALLEVGIEFPEEIDGGDDDTEQSLLALQEATEKLQKVLEGYRGGRLLRDGLRLAILGRVNAGKSSLLNRFVQKDRAIVTEHPGTTRDHIEETIDLNGLPVILIDTAGWRDTQDPVEKIGIERTKALVKEADLVLFMVDAKDGVGPEDHEIYETIQNKEKILVFNKMDLLEKMARPQVPEGWVFHSVLCASVKYDQGVSDLKACVYAYGTEGWGNQENSIVPNMRQKKLFESAYQAVRHALEGVEEDREPELIVMDLKAAMDDLDDIRGVSVKADVLDTVFSRFCIGK